VQGSTHVKGHTLDLVLTRSSESLKLLKVCNDLPDLTDHFSIHFQIDVAKPHLPKKEIQYRKLKSIDIDSFKADILTSGLLDPVDGNVDLLTDKYNLVLSEILDKHAPLKKKIITVHPEAPWMTEDIKKVKTEKRKAEHVWQKSKLEVHKQIFIELRNKENIMIKKSKMTFYQEEIAGSLNSQSALFKCVDRLLNRNQPTALPQHESTEELCNTMAEFFSEKIRLIHEGLEAVRGESGLTYVGEECIKPPCSFSQFCPVTEDDIAKVIAQSGRKSCGLDPAPTQIVKQCMDILLPFNTGIVNLSFSLSEVPTYFKIAAVTPLLKKHNLNPQILKNFCPISNLPYLSKILEKVASHCL
jgi:hypothetical protein